MPPFLTSLAAKLIGVAFVALLAAAGAGWTVHKVDDDAYKALQLADADALIASQKADAAKYSAASATYQTGNANAKVVYRTITNTVDHVVERPVYLSTCLDPDGLQLANAALAGVAAAAPSGPPAALPAAIPAK